MNDHNFVSNFNLDCIVKNSVFSENFNAKFNKTNNRIVNMNQNLFKYLTSFLKDQPFPIVEVYIEYAMAR